MIAKLHPETQRGFLIALGGLLALYLVVVAFVLIGSSSYVERLDDQFASSVVAIEVPEPTVISADFSNFHLGYEVDETLALLVAPLPELVEETAFGSLPVKSAEGLAPFKAYQRPITLPAEGKFLALGILDFGLSDNLSRDMVGMLPADVTLLASPYALNGAQWAQAARKFGHELWLHMPMETADYPRNDTGQLTILQRSSLRLNLDRLEKVMASSTGYAGLYSGMDDTFMHADALMKGVFSGIFQRGLGYLEIDDGIALTETLAAKYNAAYLKSTVFVDGQNSAYGAALDQLVAAVDANGFAMGVVRPTPALMRILPNWISNLQRQGVTLVPLSSFYQQ